MIDILIVDDNESNILILEHIIKEYMISNGREDYDLRVFSDSANALEYVQENNIDIVFLDIMMPNIDGFDFLETIRDDITVHQPKFVMVTALKGEKFKEKKQELGANAYIIKPVNDKQVKAVLDKYIT